ncbi:FG-GAP repeat domain-containing protein [Thermoactinospora rubra]|uniref:FG-GAP repeat domain-containing protein n=1 Tax=Thermoactinospora rubra TaxID=1088767 RepID=UPI000A108DD3|nr:VCBS repeat-containing protein [Thermoactinospora rubra]
MRNSRARRRLISCAVALLAGVGLAVPAEAAAAGPITRSEILERARHWYAQDPPRYDGPDTTLWLADIDGQHRYRRDCSGFVSMALHLTSSPASFDLGGYGTAIPWQDLRPGDYLTVDDGVVGDREDGHVVLFEGWAPAYPRFTYYGFGGQDGARNSLRRRFGDFSGAAITTEFADDGVNGPGVIDGHPTHRYRAFRYRNVITNDFADLDGDGRQEVVSVRTNGDVYAWRNEGGWSGTTYPAGRLVAQGFSDPVRVRFADIDGDGRDEILSVGRSGDVVAYRNRGWDQAKVYDGPDSKLVAQGFTDPVRVRFADIDGDGRDEIISIGGNGDVIAYRNLGWSAPKVYDGPASKLVAQGFGAPAQVKFADIDGDGRAEILTVNGDVIAYRNLGWDAPKVYDGPASKLVAQGFRDADTVHFPEIDGDRRHEIANSVGNGSLIAYRNLGWSAPKVYDGPVSKVLGQNLH